MIPWCRYYLFYFFHSGSFGKSYDHFSSQVIANNFGNLHIIQFMKGGVWCCGQSTTSDPTSLDSLKLTKMTKPSVRSGSIVSTARLDLTQIVNAQHWVSRYDAQEVYWRWKCVHKEERDERKKERKVIFYPWEQSESACYIFAFDQVDDFLQISFIWNNRPFQEFRSEAVGNTPYHLSSFLIILGIWKNDKHQENGIFLFGILRHLLILSSALGGFFYLHVLSKIYKSSYK